MRGAITFLLALCMAKTGLTQVFFPGKHADLFVGNSFIAAPKDSSLHKYGYRGFSLKLDDRSPISWEPMPYADLQGDTLLCTGVNAWRGNYGDQRRVLDLQSKQGNKLYYLYDPRYKHSLDLVPVHEIRIPDGYYCSEVRRTVDKFDDNETWASESLNPIVYQKLISGADTTYFLFLRTTAELPNTGDDVVLLLKSGRRLNLTGRMDISVTKDATYEARTACTLSKDNVDLLIEDPISEFRIFIYDQRVADPGKYSDMLNCIRQGKLQ